MLLYFEIPNLSCTVDFSRYNMKCSGEISCCIAESWIAFLTVCGSQHSNKKLLILHQETNKNRRKKNRKTSCGFTIFLVIPLYIDSFLVTNKMKKNIYYDKSKKNVNVCKKEETSYFLQNIRGTF